MLSVWLKFAATAAAIYFGAKQLTQQSDKLAESLGLTKGWVGFIILSFITSLPEAATSGAAAGMGNADIALGNILGSNAFNLTFIGVLTVITQPADLWQLLGFEQVLNASWFAGLTLLVVFGLTFPIALAGISLASVLILLVAILATRHIYSYHKDQERKYVPNSGGEWAIYLRLLFSSSIVVIAGVMLAGSAEELANVTGLTNTFVGSFFAALVTSMPEVIVSYHAVKLGEMDMAVGNLLGSCLFNTFLFFFLEILYFKGSIFAHASVSHLLTCFSILLLTGIILISVHYSLSKSWWAKTSSGLMSIIYLSYLWFLK